jgi:hypothetical protein
MNAKLANAIIRKLGVSCTIRRATPAESAAGSRWVVSHADRQCGSGWDTVELAVSAACQAAGEPMDFTQLTAGDLMALRAAYVERPNKRRRDHE